MAGHPNPWSTPMQRVKRDCQHTHSTHHHGTHVAYVRDKCRCDDCTKAASKAQDQRNRLIAYGRYDSGRVDAEPTRQHINMLTQYGIGLKRIALIAGVSNSTLGKIIYGDKTRNTPPRARIEKHVAQRVLAVKPELEHLGQKVCIDGTGTRRRIQALVTIGWSQARLAQQLDVAPSNFRKLMTGDNVHAGTARKVQALYEQLWNQPQAGHEHRSRIAANRAKNMAKRLGWAPPLAWDDDTIDDPAATPATAPESPFVHAEERMETIEFLLETGCGQAELISRSGYRSLPSLEQACLRQGRNDLVYRVKRIHEMVRAA